jgi:hypothetical protein
VAVADGSATTSPPCATRSRATGRRRPVPVPRGELVPADAALGILLGELVVHGWDIALSFTGRFHKP